MPVNTRPASAPRISPRQDTGHGPDGRTRTVREHLIFEQPLNERSRTFLRLEFLFEQMRAHLYRHSVWDTRAALNTLFDILNVMSRSELKSDILKELERQTAFLEKLAENPKVDSSRLEQVLGEMDTLIDRLHAMQGQAGFDLRQNEFLNSIKQRSTISGGCCDFDLPAYYHWLAQPEEKRILDLEAWLAPFDVIRESVNLILRLTRDSGHVTQEVASGGFFQKAMDPSSTCQLVRVRLPGNSPYFAEISGGKHRISIRFLEPNINERPVQAKSDIAFELTCCML